MRAISLLPRFTRCFPLITLGERLCHACPQVSVSVRSTLVRLANRSLLSARNCCHLPVLLSVEKFFRQTNEQLSGTSEAADNSVLCAFMTMEKGSWAH